MERQQFLTLAVRDYLNEGGKLVQAGESAQYQGLIGRALGGLFYGLDGAPDQDCRVTRDFLTDCGLLSDDFAQYYLGVQERVEIPRPTGVNGAGPLRGTTAAIGGPAVAHNPLDQAGAFSLTSDTLPADDFPLFAGVAAGQLHRRRGRQPVRPRRGPAVRGGTPRGRHLPAVGADRRPLRRGPRRRPRRCRRGCPSARR